jgi:hypothetical protein
LKTLIPYQTCAAKVPENYGGMTETDIEHGIVAVTVGLSSV